MDHESLLNEVLKSLIKFFGSLENPNFSRVREVYELNPHRNLISQLMQHFVAVDITDLNTDVAVVLALKSNKNKGIYFRIDLSLVDKYVALFTIENEKSIIVTHEGNNSSDCEIILKLLEEEHYTLIPSEMIGKQIPFKRPKVDSHSTVYNALFSDIDF